MIHTFINYGGITGKLAYIGKAFPQIETLGDILSRLNDLCDLNHEQYLLNNKANYMNSNISFNTSTMIKGEIILGELTSCVETILLL